TDIHQVRNRAAGLRKGDILEHFPYLIEEHDRDGLRIFLYIEGSQRRNCHQEVLVKDLSAEYVPDCTPDDIIAGNQVGNNEQDNGKNSWKWQEYSGQHKGEAEYQANDGCPQFIFFPVFPIIPLYRFSSC